jgi:hypothetical protein
MHREIYTSVNECMHTHIGYAYCVRLAMHLRMDRSCTKGFLSGGCYRQIKDRTHVAPLQKLCRFVPTTRPLRSKHVAICRYVELQLQLQLQAPRTLPALSLTMHSPPTNLDARDFRLVQTTIVDLLYFSILS